MTSWQKKIKSTFTFAIWFYKTTYFLIFLRFSCWFSSFEIGVLNTLTFNPCNTVGPVRMQIPWLNIVLGLPVVYKVYEEKTNLNVNQSESVSPFFHLNQCHQLVLIMIMFRCANSGAITCFKNGFGKRRWKNLHRGEIKLILLKRETNWFLAQCHRALKVSRPIKSLWTILENHPRPFLGKSNKMCLSALKLSRQNSENSHVIKFFSDFINFSLLCKIVNYIITIVDQNNILWSQLQSRHEKYFEHFIWKGILRNI